MLLATSADAALRTDCLHSCQPLSGPTLYWRHTGVTTDPLARIHQHRIETLGGYTADRAIKRLVWFERHDDIEVAIRREKTIKRWPRQWKFNVIEALNPVWCDLAEEFGFPPLA